MTDLTDLLSTHQTIRPPAAKVERDPALDSFHEETSQRAVRTPTGGRRTGFALEVSQGPCRAGACRHPPGTLCGSVEWQPDPNLDEIGVGWTAQHIPKDGRKPVSVHCILCWELDEHPELHDCAVLELLNS